MSTQPYLELHLHLSNGRTHEWQQNDPQLAQSIIGQLTPKVFAQPSLILYGESCVTAYPGAALIGVSVIMAELPEELLHLIGTPASNSSSFWEITEDEYSAKQRVVQPITEGEPFLMLSEIELSSGRRLYIENHVEAAVSASQERQILHHIFAHPTLACRRLDGGLSLWNRAHFVSFSFCPKPTVPANAWPAERQN